MPTERSADVEIAVAPSTAGYGVKVAGAPAAAGKAASSRARERAGAPRWHPHRRRHRRGAGRAAPARGDGRARRRPRPQAVVGAHRPRLDGRARDDRRSHAARQGRAATRCSARCPTRSRGRCRPISQGTGGDGHVPILVGSKVFAFFHHPQPDAVTCVDRAHGPPVPRLPEAAQRRRPATSPARRRWSARGSTSTSSPDGFAAQRTAQALYCWDAAKDRTCGLIVVDRVGDRQFPDASAPVLDRRQDLLRRRRRPPLLRRPRHERGVRGAPRSHRPRAPPRQRVRHRRAMARACYVSGGPTGSRRASTCERAARAPAGRCRGSSPARNLVTHHDTAGTADGVCVDRPGRRPVRRRRRLRRPPSRSRAGPAPRTTTRSPPRPRPARGR